MQEMKLIQGRFCKLKSTLLKVKKTKVYKTPTTNITFCWLCGLPWLVGLAANVVLFLLSTGFSLHAQESVTGATTFEFVHIHFDFHIFNLPT